MSGDEDFLSRWSRRKRAAAEGAPPLETAPGDPAPPPPPGDAVAAASETGEAGETEEFDLASLPPIDSIAAGTDISGFLKRGVPLDLTRAALRRAWSADPAIRDFIGLAENAWDFNDPNAMPGFGPLDQSPEDVRQMLARVMGDVRDEAEAVVPPGDVAPVAEPARISSTTAGPSGVDDPAAERPVIGPADNEVDPQGIPADSAPMQPQVSAAVQQKPSGDAGGQPVVRRAHGGALPR